MAERGDRPWKDKVLRSGFFIGAVLLHLLIFALVAACIVFPPAPRPPPDPARIAMAPPAAEIKTPVTSTALDPSALDMGALPSTPITGGAPVHVNVRQDVGETPLTDTSLANKPLKPMPAVAAAKGLSPERAKLIRDFVDAHRDGAKIRGHDPAGDYPIFVASYADGDWACNVERDLDGNIVAGSIPNLMAKILEWSHGQVRGHLLPRPLDIGGTELIKQKPPFIFFTGHKDFVLTDREVANLGEYLYEGGAIWGDNALAGSGSRFDLAFHREMKRVVGASGDFQPVAATDDLFKARYQIDHVPSGMNFFTEPVQHLDLDGKVAILYTPDDYSDLLTMRILQGDTAIGAPFPTPEQPLNTSPLFLYNSGIYFRNFTLPSSLAVHRFGMNIMTYLITRFDNDLLLTNP